MIFLGGVGDRIPARRLPRAPRRRRHRLARYAVSYGWLLDHVADGARGSSASTIACRGRWSPSRPTFLPESVALFLALVERSCVFVPLTRSVGAKRRSSWRSPRSRCVFSIDAATNARVLLGRRADAPATTRPSGAAAFGPGPLLLGLDGQEQGSRPRPGGFWRSFACAGTAAAISFLLYDHIGGINTMLYTLSNGGPIVTVRTAARTACLAAVERTASSCCPPRRRF